MIKIWSVIMLGEAKASSVYIILFPAYFLGCETSK